MAPSTLSPPSVRSRLRDVCDVFVFTPHRAIARALTNNDTPRALRLLEKHRVDPNMRLSPRIPHKKYEHTDTGMTLLHWAVWCENEDMVWALLTKGADPNSVTYFNNTPLHWAAQRSNMPLLALLIAFGGNLTAKNITHTGDFIDYGYTEHFTPLDICAQRNTTLLPEVLAAATARHQKYLMQQELRGPQSATAKPRPRKM